jgi:hypothetical protein
MLYRPVGAAGLNLKVVEPTGFTSDESGQKARAILFLTSDIAPRLKFPSLVFPSNRAALMKSLPAFGKARINSTALGANGHTLTELDGKGEPILAPIR